jgi:preprotein translocase subunit YajC
MDTQQIIVLVGGLVLLLVITVLPQWRARKRREQQKAGLAIGTEVMTVGGIIGRITHLDSDNDRARIEIARGVEMSIVMAAISRPLEPSVQEPDESSDPDQMA